MTIPVHQWQNLPQVSWNSLILGNGASITLCPGFGYSSLHSVAILAGTLPTTAGIFAALGTTDFEHVLLACWYANHVNTALGAPAPPIAAAYAEVRDALIAAVNHVHCQPATIATDLTRIGAFASRFDTVITFNYDLTLYWAMLEYNSHNGNWFKDGFINGSFDPYWKRFRAPYGATSTTMVFYAHGSLMLARDIRGLETKLASSTAPGAQTTLLAILTQAWTIGTHTPLFVSEGTAVEKRQSIRRSPYLSTVYDQVLSEIGDAAVVYGLSFAANDTHVVDALKKHPPRMLAVSVYGGLPQAEQQQFCHNVSGIVARNLPFTQIVFFDSQSPGVWNN